MKKIIIAIDGESSSGKSSLAKALSKEMFYKHINTGSMYRAVTFFALKEGLLFDDKINSEKIIKLTEKLNFDFKLINNNSNLFLDGVNVEKEIRSTQVSDLVSQVSTIFKVRKKIIDIQRNMGKDKGVVMEGRDIGTKVFPNAKIKFFITALPEIRARRRYDELIRQGDHVSFNEILKNRESTKVM